MIITIIVIIVMIIIIISIKMTIITIIVISIKTTTRNVQYFIHVLTLLILLIYSRPGMFSCPNIRHFYCNVYCKPISFDAI